MGGKTVYFQSSFINHNSQRLAQNYGLGYMEIGGLFRISKLRFSLLVLGFDLGEAHVSTMLSEMRMAGYTFAAVTSASSPSQVGLNTLQHPH
jgi:hypothetical protein